MMLDVILKTYVNNHAIPVVHLKSEAPNNRYVRAIQITKEFSDNFTEGRGTIDLVLAGSRRPIKMPELPQNIVLYDKSWNICGAPELNHEYKFGLFGDYAIVKNGKFTARLPQALFEWFFRELPFYEGVELINKVLKKDEKMELSK